MTKKPVTEKALFLRVKRELARHGHDIMACRSNSKWLDSLGRYFEIDLTDNSIAQTKVDLLARAMELGVLRPYETAVMAEAV